MASLHGNVCTPPTNRGVLPTIEKTNPLSTTGLAFENRIVLDWVTCSFDYDLMRMAWIGEELGGIKERDRGMMGYSKSGSVLGGSGSICWSPGREHQRMCLVLPATALSLLKMSAIDLLKWLRDDEAMSFSRIDLAIDDFEKTLDLGVIKEHLENGWVSSRWRVFRPDGDKIIGCGGLELQTTIYIGSRKSDSFTRVYDKAVELRSKGFQPEYDEWVRFELESKRDRANEIVNRLLSCHPPTAFIRDYVNGLIEFKEPSCDDSNKWRWAVAEWWSEFLGTIDKVRLCLPKPERTIERTKQWLWDNVAPNLAMVIGAGEYNAVINMAINGADRWSQVHRDTLKRASLSDDIARATLKALAESQKLPEIGGEM